VLSWSRDERDRSPCNRESCKNAPRPGDTATGVDRPPDVGVDPSTVSHFALVYFKGFSHLGVTDLVNPSIDRARHTIRTSSCALAWQVRGSVAATARTAAQFNDDPCDS
jgi:hypothetical protein